MEKTSGTEAFERRFNKKVVPDERKVQEIEQILNADPEVRASQQKHLDFLKSQFANVVAFLATVEDVGTHESLIRPLVHSVSELKVEVEHTYKQDKTPADAFLGKCKYTSTPVIDILQKLEIKTADPKDLDLLNIDFNILGVTPNKLMPKAFELFDRIAPDKVSRDTIRVFIDEVARGYRINAYHNLTHGFSVCQVFYFMWSVSPRLQKFLDVDEMYIGCVASFSHDIGHSSALSPSREKQPLPRQLEPLLRQVHSRQVCPRTHPRLQDPRDFQAKSEHARVLRQRGRLT